MSQNPNQFDINANGETLREIHLKVNPFWLDSERSSKAEISYKQTTFEISTVCSKQMNLSTHLEGMLCDLSLKNL